MKENEEVVCYYHNDMDGISSASIVKQVYPDAKFIRVDYGDVARMPVQETTVIVVDFSFEPDAMRTLKDSSKELIWIDHHKTSMEKMPDLWNDETIKGIRNIEKAACELTWEWFFPFANVPRAIKLIGDRDAWRFKFGDDTKAFNEYISMKFKQPDVDLLECDVEEIIQHGYLLLKKKQEQIRKTFEQGFDSSLFGYYVRVVNTNMNVSDVGEYCYKEKKYPIALIWSIRKGKIICSLRSNKIDVSKYAKDMGGGHKFAAGFEGTWGFIKEIYEGGVKK